jgi:hypothetical protein
MEVIDLRALLADLDAGRPGNRHPRIRRVQVTSRSMHAMASGRALPHRHVTALIPGHTSVSAHTGNLSRNTGDGT